MAEGIERLKHFYSRATILALIRRDNNEYANVYTMVTYGSNSTALGVFSVQVVNGSVSGATYEAHRIVVGAAVADTFLAEAKAGSARLPNLETIVKYPTDFSYDGFFPRSEYSQIPATTLSATTSCWRRRTVPYQRTLGRSHLAEDELLNIALDLPRFEDADFSLLNLQGSLDFLATIDEVFPIPVSVELRPHSTGLGYSLLDRGDWLEHLGDLHLVLDAFTYGVRVATMHVPLAASSGVIIMQAPHAFNASLLAGSLLLDGSGGTFIRSLGIDVGMMEPDVVVRAGARDVSVPVAARTRQRTMIGQTTPLPDEVGPRLLAQRWREQMNRHDKFSERVFDGFNGETCRAEGLTLLADLIHAAGSAAGRVVRVVDKYALDAEALMALVPLAAGVGVPGAEIWLLTNNDPAPSVYAQGAESREKEAARFREVALNIAARLHVKIKVFTPTIPLHDRFLQVGQRVWHVGHSFNRFGCDLSAITEFRDLYERHRLVSLLDQQFSTDGEVLG